MPVTRVFAPMPARTPEGLVMFPLFCIPRIECSKVSQHWRDGEKGFALLEALVAMMVFAIGILGLLGFQASMINEQTDAKFRADASYLANELIGIVWADIPNVANYATGSCTGYTRCGGWLEKVNNGLPSGSATITVTPVVVGTTDVVITLSWTMPNGDQHRYQTATTVALAK